MAAAQVRVQKMRISTSEPKVCPIWMRVFGGEMVLVKSGGGRSHRNRLDQAFTLILDPERFDGVVLHPRALTNAQIV